MIRKLSKDIALYGSADIIFRAAQFFAIPVYAHVLSVDDFGTMALLSVTGTLLGMLLNLGINNSVQRFYFDPEVPERERRTLVSTGLAQLILSGVVTLAGAALLLHFFGGELRQYYGIAPGLAVIVLATILPEQLTQYIQDVARLQFAPLRFLLISLVRNLFGVLFGLWLLLEWKLGIAGVLWGTLTGAAAALPIGLFLIRRDLSFGFDRRFAGQIFRYGYPFVFASAAYWVFGSMDRWMLLRFSDLTQVGLFSMGLKLAAIVSFITFAFGRAWSPFAFRMYREDPHYRENFARILSGWFFLLALVGFGLGLFAPDLLGLLTPRDYWGSAPVLALAAAGLALEGTTLVTMIGISLERRTMLLTYGAWLAAVTNVALNLLLIPRYGAVGAATATLFSYAVLTCSFLYWSQRLHPIPLERGKLLYCSGVVLASALLPPALAGRDSLLLILAAKTVIFLAAVAGGFFIGIVDRKHYHRLVTVLRSALANA